MSSLPETEVPPALHGVLERNRAFVRSREAQPFPPAPTLRLAVVACYDPRLDDLLPRALGLSPGDAFLLRTAGALVQPGGGVLRSLGMAVFLFGVTEIAVIGHAACRMAAFDAAEFIASFRKRGVPRDAFGADDLRAWAGAIASPRAGVERSIAAIAGAAFLPADVTVTGLVLDDATGELTRVAGPVSASRAAVSPAPAKEPAPAAEPTEVEAPAAEGLDEVLASVGSFLLSLESQPRWRDEVGRLRTDLSAAKDPAARLRLLDSFVRRASRDARPLVQSLEALHESLRRAHAGNLPEEFGRFFQRWGRRT